MSGYDATPRPHRLGLEALDEDTVEEGSDGLDGAEGGGLRTADGEESGAEIRGYREKNTTDHGERRRQEAGMDRRQMGWRLRGDRRAGFGGESGRMPHMPPFQNPPTALGNGTTASPSERGREGRHVLSSSLPSIRHLSPRRRISSNHPLFLPSSLSLSAMLFRAATRSTAAVKTSASRLSGLRSFASHKEIKFSNEGRAAMLKGVDVLADAVSVTLGPKGEPLASEEGGRDRLARARLKRRPEKWATDADR